MATASAISSKSGKPIIAVINGPAAGLGLVFALYADIRFAGSDVKFTTAFAQRGLIAEHGISWLLPHLVGPAHSLDRFCPRVSSPPPRRSAWASSTRSSNRKISWAR